MHEFKFSMPDEQVNVIIAALAELPLKTALITFTNLQTQMQAQMQAQMQGQMQGQVMPEPPMCPAPVIEGVEV
jgi:hypothetical protein